MQNVCLPKLIFAHKQITTRSEIDAGPLSIQSLYAPVLELSDKFQDQNTDPDAPLGLSHGWLDECVKKPPECKRCTED